MHLLQFVTVFALSVAIVCVLSMFPAEKTAYLTVEDGVQWINNDVPGTIASLNEKGDGVILRPVGDVSWR